jgi:hypothetical protein
MQQVSSTLGRLLAEHGRARWHVEYGPALSNHAAHGIIALVRLGADNATMQKWLAHYAAHKIMGHALEPPRSANDDERAVVSDVTSKSEVLSKLKGRRSNWLGLAQYFDAQLLKDDHGVVLARWLPHLFDGLHAAAFHPLIHTAMGLEAGSNETLSDGLAYIVHSHRPLGIAAPAGLVASVEPSRFLKTLAAVHDDGTLPELARTGALEPPFSEMDGALLRPCLHASASRYSHPTCH